MADTKISSLTAATAPNTGMEVPVNDGGTDRKVTVQQFLDYMGLIKGRVASTHTIGATTATEVTLTPTPTLLAGTYMFQFNLLLQTATITVMPTIGINYTGTIGKIRMMAQFVDTAAVTATGASTMATAASGTTSAAHMDANYVIAASTTAPNINMTTPTNVVGAINTDALMIIQGILVCTTSGDLELWHGSETATNTSVMADSTYMVTKVA
jgi:hypothetical protein